MDAPVTAANDILAALVAALMEDVPPLDGAQVYLSHASRNPTVRLVLADGQHFDITVTKVYLR